MHCHDAAIGCWRRPVGLERAISQGFLTLCDQTLLCVDRHEKFFVVSTQGSAHQFICLLRIDAGRGGLQELEALFTVVVLLLQLLSCPYHTYQRLQAVSRLLDHRADQAGIHFENMVLAVRRLAEDTLLVVWPRQWVAGAKTSQHAFGQVTLLHQLSSCLHSCLLGKKSFNNSCDKIFSWIFSGRGFLQCFSASISRRVGSIKLEASKW